MKLNFQSVIWLIPYYGDWKETAWPVCWFSRSLGNQVVMAANVAEATVEGNAVTRVGSVEHQPWKSCTLKGFLDQKCLGTWNIIAPTPEDS